MDTRDGDSETPESPGLVHAWRDRSPAIAKRVVHGFVSLAGVKTDTELVFESPLREWGWFRSFEVAPVDGDGQPLPWMQYSVIHFLAERLCEDAGVFEYGSGNSTRWFSRRASTVVAVEHDEEWFEKIRSSAPSNAEILHRTDTDYIHEIENHGEFDVVVIDGKDGVDCVEVAMDHLTTEGILVWDDTRRERYRSGMVYLGEQGFRELSFQGMGPVTTNLQRTSIFYRRENCLGI